MISVEEYQERYEDFHQNEEEDYVFEVDKAVRFLISDLEIYMNRHKEFNCWTDLKGDYKELHVVDVFQNSHRPHVFEAYSTLFKNFDYLMSGMVSDQVKCFRLKYNDLRIALIKSGLERCIKVELVFGPDIYKNPEIRKNADYDAKTLPYKYYTNKSPMVKYTIDMTKVPQKYLGLLRILGLDFNSIKRNMTNHRH